MALTLDFKSFASAEAVCEAIRESTREGPDFSEIGRVTSAFQGNAFEMRYADPGGGRQDPKPYMRGRVAPRAGTGCDIFVEITYGIATPAAVVAMIAVFSVLAGFAWGSPFGWVVVAGPPALATFYIHRERNISLDDWDVRRLVEGLEGAIKSADAGHAARPVGMTKREEAEARGELEKVYRDLERRE